MPEVRRRSHRKPSQFRVFLRKYRFEIIWLAVVALGVFLVFERMNVRSSMMRWARTAAAAMLRSAGRLGEVVNDFLARTTLSDAIGYALILGALMAIVLRMRWRLVRSPRMTMLKCPTCGGEIHRVHRTHIDHLISVFVPVRRYRCASRACRWQGLRVTSPKGFLASAPSGPRS